VRASRHTGERKQLDMLESNPDIHPIYNAKMHLVTDMIRSLRPDDELWVSTLGRLAPRRKELRAAMDAIHERKTVIVEAKTGRRSDRLADVAAMVLDAADELALDARMNGMTPKQAERYGRIGGEITRKRVAKEMAAKRLPKAEARNIWANPLITNAEALAAMDGWTQASAYREFGKRKLAKGRPRKNQ
jgi:hypothetical protein